MSYYSKTLSLLAAAALSATQIQAIVLPRQGSAGVTTRYYDCCKQSCSWPGKAAFSSPVTTCDINDNPLADANTVNGCPELGDGNAYTCSNQVAYAVNDDLAYGFAAVSGGDEAATCCACYKLTFTSEAIAGKSMIVQATNIGYDVNNVQFDLSIPGGGVGAFPKGCTKQYNAPANGWGSSGAYGGTASRSECDALPAKLRDGCYFRFDWFKGSDNPTVEYERVSCPAELVAKTTCRRDDDDNYPSAFKGEETSTTQVKVVAKSNPSPEEPTQEVYGQCAGQDYAGITECGSEAKCVFQDEWYSQCRPSF
ncbi:related to endoglucanase [Ramularia collo-cygni]|uniref:Cellulase n=1 Tax=Ramularia collo-cygni TaxID=112498 RepID=A0A2D3V3B1_9PEZI|nr:related to endoglucanase [Ramularia collo-cygni]CZT19950.1 related to endoglucanase [Ramularia collo-cygni]